MHRKVVVALALSLVAGGCASSRPIALNYSPPPGVVREAYSVSVEMGDVQDLRGNGANWIGAIRGGYGNPLKVLETEKPVTDVVAEMFAAGLRARGMQAAATTAYRLDIILNAFNSSQYARREAHVELTGNLFRAGSNEIAFTRDVKVDRVDGSALSLSTGVFADPELLRALANEALQEAIDEFLDSAGLQAALSN